MKRNKMLFVIMLFSLFYIPEVNAMQIFVHKTSAEKMNIEVESSDEIEKVKQKIYEMDNTLLPENQKLVFDDIELEDGRTLADYNVQKESTIYLFLIVNNEKFRVIFDANEGLFKSGNILTIEKWENGMENTLEIPIRDGYKFLGYYTEKNGGTKFEMILAESGIDSDMIFYARWEEVSDIILSETKKENTVGSSVTSEVENPKTLDNISISIFMGVVSLLVLVLLIINFRTRSKI